MKTKKYEIARAIDKLKSVVQKNESKPALSGILVKDGRLISSNSEITIHIKFEDAVGENFIIPMKAFDLIKNLPEGEVEIATNDKNIVTIKMDKIKNSYQSYPADDFMYQNIPQESEHTITFSSEKLISCIGHVIYAAADQSSNRMLTGILLESDEEGLNVVALDGHIMAWDKIPQAKGDYMRIIIPKTAAKKLLDMGMSDDVTMFYDVNSVTFKTSEYAIYSRLIDGNFYPYAAMFKDCPIYTIVNKKELSDSMTRAKTCIKDESPTVFVLDGKELKVSLRDKETNYEEQINLQETVEKPLKIAFSSKLVLNTIKAFTCENITLNFINDNMPMVVEAEDSEMKALVLPVKIRG